MRFTIAACALALAACASPQEVQEAASRASNMDLCMNLANSGRYQSILVQELGRRGENCQQYAAAMMAKQQAQAAEAARMAAAMGYLRSLQPAPQTNCTSRIFGNQVQTTCY